MEDSSNLDLAQVKLVLETALLASPEPLSLTELRKLFDEELSGDTVRNVLEAPRSLRRASSSWCC